MIIVVLIELNWILSLHKSWISNWKLGNINEVIEKMNSQFSWRAISNAPDIVYYKQTLRPVEYAIHTYLNLNHFDLSIFPRAFRRTLENKIKNIPRFEMAMYFCTGWISNRKKFRKQRGSFRWTKNDSRFFELKIQKICENCFMIFFLLLLSSVKNVD